jgi:hypothetical protein
LTRRGCQFSVSYTVTSPDENDTTACDLFDDRAKARMDVRRGADTALIVLDVDVLTTQNDR